MLREYILKQKDILLQLSLSFSIFIIFGVLGLFTTLIGLQQEYMPKTAPIMLIIALISLLVFVIILSKSVYTLMKIFSKNKTSNDILTNIIREYVRKDVTNDVD